MSVIQIVPVSLLAGPQPEKRVINGEAVTIINPRELSEELRGQLEAEVRVNER